MALLGKAALAMWWDMSGARRAEFEHWHTHEHFPERLAISGFRRATRWTAADGGEGVFVMYELESYDVLSSPAYLARLNAPTPWSTRMMPHHRNMVRSQCRVLASRGSATSRRSLTVRLSPAPGCDTLLRQNLAAQIERLFDRPGLTGIHLLQHETPPISQTTEQRIRGGDRFADWVLVACGYDGERVSALAVDDWSDAGLVSLGAAPGRQVAMHALSHTATPGDMA